MGIVKGKDLVGSVIGLLGGILVFIAGIYSFVVYFPYYASFGAQYPALVPPLLGVLGLIGAMLVLFGKRKGIVLEIIMGLLIGILQFIAYGPMTGDPSLWNLRVTYSLFYLDPFILLIGGILSLVIKELEIETEGFP